MLGRNRPEGGRRALLIFLVVLLAARVLFLVAALEPEEERVLTVFDALGKAWPKGPERSLYDREELYAGAAAQAVRMGLPLPLDAYRFMPYGHGSLLVSLAAVPIFSLLGPHYLAFKIIPLLVTLLGGLFWFLSVRAWAGPRAAGWFGALYLLAPPVLVRTALISKGDHPEAMMWIGLVLWLGTKAALSTLGPAVDAAAGRATGTRAGIWAGLAGLAAGLGIFLTYSVAPVLGGAGLAAAVRSRFRPVRPWLFFLGGFALGLVPWIIGLAGTGGGALRIYNRPLGSMRDVGEAWGRLRGLLGNGLAAGYDLPPELRPPAAWIWLAAVAAGLIWLGLRRRNWITGALLVGIAAHLGAFLLLAPDASSRYLLPVYPLLLAAAAAPAGWIQGAARRWSLVLPAAVLLLGLMSQATVLAGSRFTALRYPLRGHDWPLLGEVLGAKLAPSSLSDLPAGARYHLWLGAGRRSAWSEEPAAWAATARVAAGDSLRYYRGIGIGLMESGRVLAAAGILPKLHPEARSALRDGLVEYGEVSLAPILAQRGAEGLQGLLNRFDPEDRPSMRLGLARTLGVLTLHGGIPEDLAVRVAAGLLEPAEALVGAGWAVYRSSDPGRGLVYWDLPAGGWLERAFREGNRDAVAEGLSRALEWNLSTRALDWMEGPSGEASALGRELASCAEGWPASAAGRFYRAGGAALGEAGLLAPGTPSRIDFERAAGGIAGPFSIPFRQGFTETQGAAP